MLITLTTYTLYALAFFTPLVFTTWNFELFEFPKFVLLLGISLILLVAMVGEHLISRRSPLTLWQGSSRGSRLVHIAVLGILLTQLLATFTSIETTTSLWGYYGRFHQGLITTLCYTIIYLAASIYLNKQSTQNMIKASVTSSILVSIYAIAQHFGIDRDLWVQDVQNRVFATLGQPNWLAAYLLPNIFLLLHLDYLKTHHKRFGSLLTYALFTLLLLALLYTKSRSGLLAFGAGYLAYWLLMIRNFSWSSLKHRITATTLLSAVIIILIGTPFNPLVSSSIPQSPTPALEGGGTESGVIRQIVWQGATELIRSHPLLGTGPETFAYTYYQARPIAHNYVSEWDFLYNKAHNEYLNIGATTGLIGLAGYILFHISLVYLALTKIKSKPRSKAEGQDQLTSRSFQAVVLGSIITFTVTNFFGFSVIAVYLLITLIASFFNTRKESLARVKDNRELLVVLVIAITLLLPLRLYVADYNYATGKKLVAAGQLGQALPLLEAAHSTFPSFDVYLTTLGESYATVAADLATQEDMEALTATYISKAIATSSLLQEANSYHQNNLKSVAKVYLTLATIDPGYYTQAMHAIQRAKSLAPTDPKVAYNLALISTRVGDNEQAINELRRAIELRSIYADPYYALTLLYEETKQTDLIPPLLRSAEANLATYSAELGTKIDNYR
jgi:O-antigen ligase